MTKALMARLDRLLANLGYGSRKDVQALVAAGKVVLDGKTLKDSGARIAVDATLPARPSIRPPRWCCSCTSRWA
jgi:16S rRNA pseudouridine516 synthase